VVLYDATLEPLHQPWQGFDVPSFSYIPKIAYSTDGPLELLSWSCIIPDDLINEEQSGALHETAISRRLQLEASTVD
jgi:hypothetical protein